MTNLDLVFGLMLGGLAALSHLAMTRRRATIAVRGGVALALAMLPISVAATLEAT